MMPCSSSKKEEDAKQFLHDLNQRVTGYDLCLNQDKTNILVFTKENHQQFNFLGLTFYWGKQGRRILLKVKTQKERLIRAMQEYDHWIKRMRNALKLNELWNLARAKIRGHVNYYGFWMNALKLNHFYWEAVRSTFKWLNRRSQKRSYTWKGFTERLKHFPLMEPPGKIKLKQLGWNPYG